jgi:hypothetical protein
MLSDSLYTPEVAAVARSVKKPFDFTVHISEFPDTQELAIQVFENEIMRMPLNKRQDVMVYLETVCAAVKATGVKCFIQGVKGNAGSR